MWAGWASFVCSRKGKEGKENYQVAFVNHLEAFLKDNLAKTQTAAMHIHNCHICRHRANPKCEIQSLIIKPITPKLWMVLGCKVALCSLLGSCYETTQWCMTIQMALFCSGFQLSSFDPMCTGHFMEAHSCILCSGPGIIPVIVSLCRPPDE